MQRTTRNILPSSASFQTLAEVTDCGVVRFPWNGSLGDLLLQLLCHVNDYHFCIPCVPCVLEALLALWRYVSLRIKSKRQTKCYKSTMKCLSLFPFPNLHEFPRQLLPTPSKSRSSKNTPFVPKYLANRYLSLLALKSGQLLLDIRPRLLTIHQRLNSSQDRRLIRTNLLS